MSVEKREELYKKVAEELGVDAALVKKIAESQTAFVEDVFENKFSTTEPVEINLFFFGKFTSLENKIKFAEQNRINDIDEIILNDEAV